VSAESFALIVIGAGAAARTAAQRAATDHGASVAMIDRGRWGGACALVACKPTKAYVEAARLARDLRAVGPRLGLPGPSDTVSLAAVRAWKDWLVGTPAVWRRRFDDAGTTTIEGTASFVDAGTVRVGGRELSAERILVATGSKPAVPPIEGLDGVAWLDNAALLELDELPERLLVLGAGPAGLELGQAFSRFGSRVTIVGPHVAGRADADAARALTAALVADGLEIVLDGVTRFSRDGAGVVATLAGGGEVHADALYLAAGRAPDLDELGLDAIGVQTSRAGIVVDGHMRTSVPGIWAAGDVAGVSQLTSTADYEARVAVRDMFTDDAPPADYTALPTSIFTDPELASVGLTEQEARAGGDGVDTVVYGLDNLLRPYYTHDEPIGLFKVVFDVENRRVLGVHVVARSGGEVVQGLAPALRLGLTVEQLAETHYVFPSIGEGVKEAAELAEPVPAAAG
jgi:mercuric reductase